MPKNPEEFGIEAVLDQFPQNEPGPEVSGEHTLYSVMAEVAADSNFGVDSALYATLCEICEALVGKQLNYGEDSEDLKLAENAVAGTRAQGLYLDAKRKQSEVLGRILGN